MKNIFRYALMGAIAGLFGFLVSTTYAKEVKGFNPHPAYGTPVKIIKGDYASVLYKDRGHYILMYVKDGKCWGMIYWRIDHEELKPGVSIQGYITSELDEAHPEIKKAIDKANNKEGIK